MMLEEEDRLKELEDRERAMRQLESDIGDVNEIFKDLATLVHDQGEIIDSIESNIETTAVHVETGAEQLRQVGAGPQPSVHYLYSVLTGSSLSKQSKEEEDNSGSFWNYIFSDSDNYNCHSAQQLKFEERSIFILCDPIIIHIYFIIAYF